MLKQVFIILIYLLDYSVGRLFYIFSYLLGKTLSQIHYSRHDEINYLRQEVRRLRFANSVMRQELNRVKTKRPCVSYALLIR